MRVGTRETRPVLRTLGLTAAIALVMALVPGLASAQTVAPDARGTSAVCDGSYESNFDDIAGSAHEGNIRCMADYGLTEGLRGGTSYGPRLDVNRGQMASFIARFIEDYNDEDLPAGDANRFNDVASSYVHASNINKLAAIGVVEGTGASAGQSYAPNAGVTRAQMGSFIRRALSYLDNGQVNPLSAPPPAAGNFFPDIAGSVHQANINAIAGVGIVQGFQDGTYRPNALVKRDQMASFIMRAYDYAVTEDLGAPVGPQVGITIDPTGPVEPGATLTVTVTGDLDEIDAINVAGDCIEDGALTLGEGGTATIVIGAEAADGDCVLTFTVTFDDDTTQTVTLTVPVLAPVPGSISGTVTEPGTTEPGGATFTAIAEDGFLQIGNEVFDLPGCPEGVPPEEGDDCIEFAGDIDAEGNVTIGDDGISFPQLVTEFEAFPGVFVDVFIDISAPGGATGTADAETGAWVLNTALDIDVEVEGLAQCAISDIGLTLTTDGEGSPLTDGRATLFDDTFAVPAATGAALCAAVSGGLGLPSESGNNAVSFDLLVDVDESEIEVPGAPIAGATVSVDGTELSATTDADGTYTITGAPAGTWDVTASADGYESETITGVEVVAGQDTSGVDFVLESAEPVVDLQITITGDDTVEDGEYAYYTANTVNLGGGTSTEDIDVVREVRDSEGELVEDAIVEWDFLGINWVTNPITVDAGEIGPDFDNTGEWRVLYPGPGEYTFTLTAVGADSDEVYATDSITTTVTEAEEPGLFEPGEFTMTVEAGGIVIGINEEEPYEIDFTECPDGVGEDCITFEGTIDADGNFTVDPEDVFFPESVQEALPGVDVFINTGVAEAITGTIDPETGAASFDLPMQVEIAIPLLGAECQLNVNLEATTGDSGTVSGSAFDGERVTVVDGQYGVDETTSLEGDCGVVDDTVGLPSAAGENTAEFQLLFTQHGDDD